MLAGTALIAIEAELASAALEATSTQLGLSPVFMGVVVLALVGTASDLFAAVVFARQDKMDIVFGMCIGSAIQIALVVAPVLVLASWVIGYPMNLVFGSPLDLFAIASAAFIVRVIASDGETTWFEGLLLVGVYLLFALAYYFEGPVRSQAHAPGESELQQKSPSPTGDREFAFSLSDGESSKLAITIPR
jgi:Ca2+:H+ antiporter